MRSIICATVMALATTTAGALEFDYSAKNLVAYCKAFIGEGTQAPNAIAASHCNGMMAMLAFTAPYLADHSWSCMQIPTAATLQQIARVAVRYIEARPQRMHEQFMDLAIEALHNAWPCPSTPSTEFDKRFTGSR
jgi:hypothetical protein